ncbi:hypothetical protein MUK42_35748 [Musa troglodytarum]|uniref:BIRD-IDD transcription factor fourth C2HC zinc finger domain-containing protein n=1 Tax=Musa troglodytarum TaxID=320322 RepID=A0A9E7FJJ4_9LILI|nr:hypothetical protein MUK42_35748 [Musa troglodytarum]
MVRRDSFVTHRAFCDALAEESSKTASPPTDPKPSAEDDGSAAAAAETTAASEVVGPPFSLQQVEPLVRQEPENPIGSLQYVPPPSTSIANTSCATASSSSSSRNTSLFASLFASSTTTAAAHTTSLSDRMGAVGHDDRPLMEPPSLCLVTNGGPASLFSPQAQAHGRRPFAPPAPSPHMSATALLQKAAQMGATPTGSSFLEGFGLDAPTGHQEKMIQGSNLQRGHHHRQHQHHQPETEQGAPMLSAWLGLGLAYEPDLMMGSSSLFRAKPATTLDFLGLGRGAVGGSAKGGLSAFTTSGGGGGVDMRSAAATGEWKGAERKPASPSVL